MRPTSPGRLFCGSVISGQYNNEPIWFPIDLEFTADVIITTCNSEFDTDLQLYNEANVSIADDQIGCGPTLGFRALLEYPDLPANTGQPTRYWILLKAGDLSTGIVISNFQIGIICNTPTPTQLPPGSPPTPQPVLPLTPEPTEAGNKLSKIRENPMKIVVLICRRYILWWYI